MTNRFKPELMSQLPNHTLTRHQQGVVLLLMLVILVLAGSAFLLNGLDQRSTGVEQQLKQTQSLAIAKKALLARAASSSHKLAADPGYYSLPCPDILASDFPEGSTDGGCGARGVTTVGRLPWRTLGLDPTEMGTECFWYVISGNYQNLANPAAGLLLNSDSNGLIEIQNVDGDILAGATPDQRAVAAIIAPGSARTGQNRTALPNFVDHCGGNYVAANYLDSANGINNATPSTLADTVSQLVTTTSPDAQLNDQIVWITREEIAAAFSKRPDYDNKIDALMTQLAQCLTDYAAADPAGLSRLPWAAPLTITDYRDNDAYIDVSGQQFGRIAFDTTASKADSSNELSDTLMDSCFTIPSEINNYRKHWKDHLFYAVTAEHNPNQTITPNCLGNCLQVDDTDDEITNPTGDYAAVLFFAESRLPGQTRDATPPSGDADTKQFHSNYLEADDLTTYLDSGGNTGYQTASVSGGNDRLFCITSADILSSSTPSNACP